MNPPFSAGCFGELPGSAAEGMEGSVREQL